MARLSGFFIEYQPPYIIQRGNNKDINFTNDGDYPFYLECLTKHPNDLAQKSMPLYQ